MNVAFINKSKIALTLLASVAMLFALVQFVDAHTDPGGCDANGVGLSLSVYRADQSTVISALSTVESGETVYYRATLSHLGATNCNFSDGSLAIVTPDGVSHVVTNPVPLVSSGSPHVSPFQGYVVSEANVVSGNIKATANYVGGVSHTGGQHDDAQASVNRNTPYQDVALQVSKTATPAATEGFRWTVDKTVTPEVWDLFDGDSGTSEYTIDVQKISTGVNYTVAGNITIHNPAQFASAHITDVNDSISGLGAVTVSCPGGLPQDLAAGADLVCTYSYDLGSDDTARNNHVDVVTTGDVDGGSADAEFDPATATPVDNGGTVYVDDTFASGDKSGITDSTTYKYSRTFTCDADEGQKDNTADLYNEGDELIDSDSASVQVNCYDLEVEKTAVGTYDVEWDWTIDKSADQTDLLLQSGQIFTVNYEVEVSAQSTQSNGSVSGKITITNNHPSKDADLTDVIDELDGAGTTVSCPAMVVPAGGTLECDYGPVATDAELNVATATQQNYSYDKDKNATPSGTTDYSGQAAVNYSLGSEIDECIDVTDDNVGSLGTVCADELPKTFTYSLDFGTEGDVDVVLECGENEHPNIADFITNDTGATGSDTWTVYPEVQCQLGCTLTQGYWKTHNESFKGGAPADEGWLTSLTASLELTQLFDSGMTWFDAFWTAPKGNAWFNLAHQWMAAWLNAEGGASVPAEVQTALDYGQTHLTMANLLALSGKGKSADKVLKQEFIDMAGVLGSYNEGLIGPGHCDEDSSSAN